MIFPLIRIGYFLTVLQVFVTVYIQVEPERSFLKCLFSNISSCQTLKYFCWHVDFFKKRINLCLLFIFKLNFWKLSTKLTTGRLCNKVNLVLLYITWWKESSPLFFKNDIKFLVIMLLHANSKLSTQNYHCGFYPE